MPGSLAHALELLERQLQKEEFHLGLVWDNFDGTYSDSNGRLYTIEDIEQLGSHQFPILIWDIPLPYCAMKRIYASNNKRSDNEE